MDPSPMSKRMPTVKFNPQPPSRPVSPLKLNVSTNTTNSFRPKSKINSSATSTRKAVTVRTVNASPSPSPTKLTPRVRKAQPNNAPSLSAPVTPELRNRSFTTSSASSSLHHVASFSSFQPSVKSTISTGSRRLAPSKSVIGLSEPDREGASSPAMRIRSKVSTMAKSQSESVARTTSPPLHPSTRPAGSHSRSPSMTSILSTSPPPTYHIYPITSAAIPAANPYRYAQPRPPPTVRNPSSTFQSLSPLNDRPPRSGNIVAKVDPVSVPLPPHSPPTSALSFSSRSSLSQSPASYTAGSTDSRPSSVIKQPQNGNAEHLSSTLDSLAMHTSPVSGDDGDSAHDQETDGEIGNNEDRKVKAEAKSNRKIADLEITNRSLLAINASLEATKHRQSKEIRELRRKLRESRLILPPVAFRASLELAEEADDEEEDIDDDSETEDLVQGSGDDMYKRIKLILDNLLQTGKRALETQVNDFPEGGKGGAKVLSPEELRDWHGSNEHDLQSTQNVDGDEQRPKNVLPQEAELSFDDDDTLTSEDEVEGMTLPYTPPQSPLPPILITQSTG